VTAASDQPGFEWFSKSTWHMLLCVNPYACTNEDELGVGKYWQSPVEV
jgi:hypothetical protein